MNALTTTPDLARAARWFHALSDETRLHIVWLLAGGERCVCDLQEALDAAQSRLSFHLKTLREAGLVHPAILARGGPPTPIARACRPLGGRRCPGRPRWHSP